MMLFTLENFIKEFSSSILAKGSVITIGNFDGCHLGHKKLLKEAKAEAEKRGLLSLALTFDPHPKFYFMKNQKPSPIFTIEQKIQAISEIGIDITIIQKFNKSFSELSPETFYSEGLKNKLQAKVLVLGKNFCFGANKQGNVKWLKERTSKDGIFLKAVPLESFAKDIVNSTSIKNLLMKGSISKANSYLGHSFSLLGTICEGNKLGRTLGFPTANFDAIKQIIPQKGVYYGYIKILREGISVPEVSCLPSDKHLAVLNIGKRPTITKEKPAQTTVEAHIIGKNFKPNELYGKRCAFYFFEKLRDEKKFASLEELKKQIGKDLDQAQKLITQESSL